jgi:anaphase-promoting complex subunit 3
MIEEESQNYTTL